MAKRRSRVVGIAALLASSASACDLLVGEASPAELAAFPHTVRVPSLQRAGPALESLASSNAALSANGIQACLTSEVHSLVGEPWVLPSSTPANVIWRPSFPEGTPVVSGGLPLNKWRVFFLPFCLFHFSLVPMELPSWGGLEEVEFYFWHLMSATRGQVPL